MGEKHLEEAGLKRALKDNDVKDNGVVKAVKAYEASDDDDLDAQAEALELIRDLGGKLKKMKDVAEEVFEYLGEVLAEAAKAQRELEAQQKEAESEEGPDASKATEKIGPVAESTYNVGGKSLEDLLNAINARGQNEAAEVAWSPTYTSSEETGKVSVVKVTVPITMEMPNWTGRSSAGKNTQAEYDRVMAALRKHEDGHVDLVHEHFDGLAKQMLGKSKKDAEALFQKAKADLKKASDAYDTSTGHGEKQGAHFDLDIED